MISYEKTWTVKILIRFFGYSVFINDLRNTLKQDGRHDLLSGFVVALVNDADTLFI